MEKLIERIVARGPAETAKTGGAAVEQLKLVSWNLLHRSGAMVEDIAQIIRKENPDLFLMQEATDAIATLPAHAGGKFYAQSWPGRHHGLAAWSSEKHWTTQAIRLPESKMPGRLPARFAQILEVAGITVANVHLSHGQFLNRRQLRRISHSTTGPTAIIGDFNAVGPIMLHGFRDVGPRRSTHHAQELLPFRLDRCMARGLRILEARTLDKGASDHRPILVEFDYQPESPSPA